MAVLRYHLLALLAALLALLVGVVLGAGPVAERGETRRAAEVDRLRTDRQALQQRVAVLDGHLATSDAFVREVAGSLTAGRLTGHSVVVFALPGARPRLVQRAESAVRAAGATLTGTVSLTEMYVDPRQARSPLEDLALRLVPPGVEFPEGATAIGRVGTVLARATVTGEAEQTGAVDQKAAELLAGMEELGALHVTGEAGRRAELAVVVAPPGTRAATPGGDARGADEALLALADALDAGGRGVVVTGGRAAAAGTGLIAALRASRGPATGVTTVDVADRPIGGVALVLGLAEQLAGRAGHYGVAPGADQVVPGAGPAATSGAASPPR